MGLDGSDGPVSRRTAARRAPLRNALVLLALTACALAAVECVLVTRTVTSNVLLSAAFPLVGGGFVLIGAYAWLRRPDNPTGTLLCVTGLFSLGAVMADASLPVPLSNLGLLLGETPIAAVLHVVLAFPSGRLQSRADTRLVVTLYLLVLVRQLPVALPGPDLEPLRLACSLLGSAVLVVAAVRLLLRVGRDSGDARRRRALSAVYGYGMALLLFFPISARVLRPLLGLDEATLGAVQVAGLAVLPLVFAAGVLRGGFAWTYDLDQLSTWLGAQAQDQETLRAVLSQVLGDPSLTVLFDPAAGGALLDQDARAVPAEPPRARGSVRLRDADGRDAGVVLTYDRGLFPEADAIEQAGRVVAGALERERLRSDLLAERQALRASRSRVIEIGDLQRRQLAQDLHDVLQSRITLAAMHAGRLAAASPDDTMGGELRRLQAELGDLTAEMRQVVHGVMPALLLERGLTAAVEDLADRMPLPTRVELDVTELLPPAVATNSYFILAETLTNVVRHSHASTCTVRVVREVDRLHLEVVDDGVGGARATGAGLRGITERVEALEGSLALHSPVDVGTRVEVVLPCGS